VEIVAESTLWFEYIFVLSIIGICFIISVLGFIIGLATIFDRTFSKDFSGYAVTAGSLLLTALFSAIFYGGIKAGPTVQYKATITDFNEVYNNGYEIIDREGDLYILQESEAD
jgi:hypothetical protein